MSVKSLLDTNILIYLFDSSAPEKQKKSRELVEKALMTKEIVISQQVLQETLNVLVKKYKWPFEDASKFSDNVLFPLLSYVPPERLYRKAIQIKFHYHFSFYDSLVLSAGIELGCSTLYTEDLQNQQKIENLTIVNPY